MPLFARLMMVGVVVLGGACGGASEPSGGGDPTTGSLVVSATSTGNSIDADGYSVSVDGGSPVWIGTRGSATFTDLSPGSHTVVIIGLATNCAVVGAASRTVTVVAGLAVSVPFNVTCLRIIRDQIVYQLGGGAASGIGLINPNGTDQLTLLLDGFHNRAPAVSPDGLRIAFISDKSGKLELYVMNSEGGNIQALTPQLAFADSPAWSPDGQRIVFLASRSSQGGIQSDIGVIDAGGGTVTYLTNDPEADDDPSWSPDGTRIVFRGSAGADGLYVMDADGRNRTLIPNTHATDQAPRWSPDGSRIAFSGARDGGWEIYTIQPDGTGLQRLTFNVVSADFSPSWSPDGTRLVFASDRSGTLRLHTMDAASGANALGPFGSNGQRPHWSK